MSLRKPCTLLEVCDADTLQVLWDHRPHKLRLMDVAPERGRAGRGEAATAVGREALQWARSNLTPERAEYVLDFPSGRVQFSNSGSLLAYLLADGENVNVRLVRDGFSPYFEKYGHPRGHRAAMEEAERRARWEGRGLWGQSCSARDYGALKRYWQLRAGQVESYRLARTLGEDVLGSRAHYDEIVARAKAGSAAVLFADVGRSYRLSDGSTLFQLGSPCQPLCAMAPPSARGLADFIEREFCGEGRPNYLFFRGPLSMAGDHPQVLVETMDQYSTCPPGMMN